jgi:hypothetical protein
MDKFKDAFDLSKLNQKDINHLNTTITSNQIEAIIKSPNKESPSSNGLTAKFYQIFIKEIAPILLKLFHEIKREGTLCTSFCKANIILIPKLDKDSTTQKTIHH